MRMKAVLVGSLLAVVGGVTGLATASAMVAPDLPESTPSVTAEPSVVPSATSTPTLSEVAVTLTPAVTPKATAKPAVTAKPVPKPADPVTGVRPSEPLREAWTAPPPTYVPPPAPR